MSVRNGIVLSLALSTLTLLVACGGSSGPAKAVAPPGGSFTATSLNGTYVFSVSGTDSNGAPYAMIGTLTANTSGGITGGTFDINDADTSVFTSGPIAGASINNNGTYSIGVDGRGQASFGTNISGFPTLTLDLVLSSSSHGLITEFDSFGSGSGTLDLQTAGVSASGSYAFSLSGSSYSLSPWATAGNFAVTGAAIAGLDDFNEGGLLAFPNQQLTGGLVLGPSSNPSTTLSTAAFNGLFDAVAIDATHLKLIEMDSQATLSGDAFSQPSATMPQGTMAFTIAGDLLAAGGFMTTSGTDAAGSITGTEDYNDSGTLSSSSTAGPFGASYTAVGTGRYELNSFVTFVGGTDYAAYPSSGGLLLLEIDSGVGITVGAAYPQTPGATFAASQGYGLNLTGTYLGANTGGQQEEIDDIAEFTAASAGTLTGIIDENFDPGGAPLLGSPLESGTYGTIDSSGRYGLSATAGTSASNTTLNGGFALTFYAVDGTTFPFIESDSGQVATGVIVLQSPSAASPAAAHPMFVVRPLIRPHTLRKKTN